MAEKPILFSDALVRAILDGKKTETRRPIAVRGLAAKLVAQATEAEGYTGDGSCLRGAKDALVRDCSPFGAAGDKLWIRECFALEDCGNDGKRIIWRADRAAAWWNDIAGHMAPIFYLEDDYAVSRWKPSIHMPRAASRIMLEITEVHVERVQDITEEGARREGFEPQHIVGALMPERTARAQFSAAWAEIYGAQSWDERAWVWVVCFRRLS